MKPEVLPDSALAVLRHLGEYRFLTAAQLVGLGGARSTPRSMSNLLRQLESKNRLVGKIGFGVHPTEGKLENVYFLRTKGAALLERESGLPAEAIKYPKSVGTLFQRDYFHRLACLDFEIAFKAALRGRGFDCLRFDRYFDPMQGIRATRGGTLPAVTSIPLASGQSIIPDAVAIYHNGERPFLFLAEASMGNDAKRVADQLRTHVTVLGSGAVSDHFRIPYGHFVACLFESAACMQSVMRQLANDPEVSEHYQRHFLFAQLAGSVPEEWSLWDGSKALFHGF